MNNDPGSSTDLLTEARVASASPVLTAPDRPREPVAPGRRRRLRADQVSLYLLLLIATVSALFPILFLLSGSLQSIDELYSGQSFFPSDPQWGNYVTAWVQGDLGAYLLNSAVYTTAAVIGILIISSMAGYALARLEFAGKAVFTGIILAVMIIPAPAMFLAQYKLMIAFGLTNNRIGYILILITAGIPVATLIMRGFFVSQPKDLEEAAALDGASPFGIFWRVILPLARPGLAAVAVVQGLGVWNEYLMALVLFDDDSLMPIQRGLTSFVSAETPQQQILLAATTISIVPVVVFYLFAQRHIVNGIGAGALK
ncbi:ABC transporter permease subunit (plasmid) [Rathayibacter sp. VKM Ac-2803]|uniref:Carbohydrate ABC transporter permease n=1 Tax=Rathayibacter caricis DSM 15933 TaxID=1328867 RepID=A0A2T4UNQ9_9MICO|nr:MULTISPECIES: carbohydrate ABC transporter permease [Rathayibacter]MWV51565.1 ABC transporter permease subunit [Rathayibacter sp. VKM Ac-2803]PTL71166.1 carbohydrate ABC transporter permease [Rathayibacter caricis DSM 15933]